VCPAFETGHLFVLFVGVGVDASDVGVAEVSQRESGLAAAAGQVEYLIGWVEEGVFGGKFLFYESFDVVAVGVEVLLALFLVVLGDADLLVDLSESTFHIFIL
jgi:predicted transporter